MFDAAARCSEQNHQGIIFSRPITTLLRGAERRTRARTGIDNINNEFNSFRDDGWNAELVYMCAGTGRVMGGRVKDGGGARPFGAGNPWNNRRIVSVAIRSFAGQWRHPSTYLDLLDYSCSLSLSLSPPPPSFFLLLPHLAPVYLAASRMNNAKQRERRALLFGWILSCCCIIRSFQYLSPHRKWRKFCQACTMPSYEMSSRCFSYTSSPHEHNIHRALFH